MIRIILLTIGLAFATFQPMLTESANAQVVSGPRVEITITDELLLEPGAVRTAQRDSTDSLITLPGDIILYTIDAINKSNQPAYEAEIVDPIPEGTEYVLDSATGDGMIITYSIDNGRFFQPQPITYDSRNPDGTIEKRPALPNMYTHIKWLVTEPIQPNSSVTATFQVKVSVDDASIRERQ